MHVVFWQNMLTPHMLGLAEAIAARGIEVTFVATEQLSDERKKQGWQVPLEVSVKRKVISCADNVREFLSSLPPNTNHIVQGIRGNGQIGSFRRLIYASGQPTWAIMETVDDRGLKGKARNFLYSLRMKIDLRKIKGILAIGRDTGQWLIARGAAEEKIFPFAYFVEIAPREHGNKETQENRPFTYAYVGNFEPWKNPLLAIDAFSRISSGPRRLKLVGSGSLTDKMYERAQGLPGEAEVEFLGRLPMQQVPAFLRSVDCLLLPSNVDGWGVVASEAMLVGTPVIASRSCGVSSVVEAAPEGDVFSAGDLEELQTVMTKLQRSGYSQERRERLEKWATPLGAAFGAKYLEAILSGVQTANNVEWLQLKRGET